MNRVMILRGPGPSPLIRPDPFRYAVMDATDKARRKYFVWGLIVGLCLGTCLGTLLCHVERSKAEPKHPASAAAIIQLNGVRHWSVVKPTPTATPQ